MLPETRYSLIARLARSEDVATWEEFLETYESAIRRYCRSRGLQDADARDVSQQGADFRAESCGALEAFGQNGQLPSLAVRDGSTFVPQGTAAEAVGRTTVAASECLVSLGRLTSVPYKSHHDGPWWRGWWNANRSKLPVVVRSMQIADLPKTAFGATYKSTSQDIESHEGRMKLLKQELTNLAETGTTQQLGTLIMEIAQAGDPRAIPVLIGGIDADNSYDTVYGIGYFGLGFSELGKMTGVRYSSFHDGAWWRRWWQANKDRFPTAANIEIPLFPRTASGKAHKPFPSDLDTHEGRVRFATEQLKNSDIRLSKIAELFAGANDPRGIPVLIGIIVSDKSEKAVYDVGYFGLGLGSMRKFTKVNFEKAHDAVWWKAWWATHRDDFPTAKDIEIPTFQVAPR